MMLRTLPASSSRGAVDQAITSSSPRRLTNVFSHVAAGWPGLAVKRARTSSRSEGAMKTSQKYSWRTSSTSSKPLARSQAVL